VDVPVFQALKPNSQTLLLSDVGLIRLANPLCQSTLANSV